MADIFTKEKRRQIMAAVKNKNTKPEILVRKSLFRQGFRYRTNSKAYIGSPDIVLPKYHCIVFIHGCFWHGHRNCKKQIRPKSNKSFWKEKVDQNKVRDRKCQRELTKQGWRIFTVWGCELANGKVFDKTMATLSKNIKNN